MDPNNGRRKRRKTTSPKDKVSINGRGTSIPDEISTLSRPGFSQRIAPSLNGTGNIVNHHVDAKQQPLKEMDPLGEQQDTLSALPKVEAQKEFIPTGSDTSKIVPSASEFPDNSNKTELMDLVSDPKDGPPVEEPIPMENKPKKILRLNPKTGTIGSPPSKKTMPPAYAEAKTRPIRGTKQPKSMIVTIRYGPSQLLSSETGEKIGAILNGSRTAGSYFEKKVIDSAEDSRAPKSMTVSGTGTTAAPHPFFLPKIKPEKTTTIPSKVMEMPRPKEFTTLAEARTKSRDKLHESSKLKASTTAFAGFGNTARLTKFPGAVEPAWPWKGMTHVRGVESNGSNVRSGDRLNMPQTKSRKSKYHAVQIAASEDIMETLARELVLDQVVKSIRDVNLDEYPPLPACLRSSVKHFEAGTKLQVRVRRELKTRLPLPEEEESSEDELQRTGPHRSRVHPALTIMYTSIATSLSAFDQSRCETQPWILKHSPKFASEVLQTGREALILKEWLQTLIVMSVETASASASIRSSSAKPEPGKRKRKSKKLDGFVVSSDEENDMDEISEPEGQSPPRGSQGLLKTVIRSGDRGSKDTPRLANGVVISGPHGCGKTAMVYAVAKELGFEVFEINSSSRRSGKDILEKVGDMTRNHLVQRSHAAASTDTDDDDVKRISDALEDDLKTSRQGTMDSFFKLNEAKAKPKKQAPATKKAETTQQVALPKMPKKQKQSLILFEEADVLYEEDKQFWQTVMTMIFQSKRPIIMTCTDESAIPIAALSLHAIIRLTPPPIDLATDYMLLVAANEGHIIRREAIKALYESRQMDLRASLTELNFWCQFAVGDVRGGLDWFYARWPPGKDVDEHGNTIRVISEGTYETGMGWLSQDFLESHLHYLDIEEETLHEAWDGWHLDGEAWQKSLNLSGWAKKMQSLSNGSKVRHAALAMYDDYADAMSVADICSAGKFATDKHVPMDTTLPELSPKAREDYIISHELLEASPVVSFENFGADVSFWMQSRARKYLQVDQHNKYDLEVPTQLDRPTEADITNLIRELSLTSDLSITRKDLSLAFDPISEPEKSSMNISGSLDASSFDRTTTLIATDIAPYIRSIVSYDARLQQERARLSNLLSEGGRKNKRMRTTRSAMSALEGGARNTTRRDRYFGSGLNPHFVLKTGLPSWLEAVSLEMTALDVETKGEVETEEADDESTRDELAESTS